jgi:hypothetical protein
MNKILIHITLIAVALLVAMTPSCSDEMIVEPVPDKPTQPPIDDPFKDGELPINLPVTRSINEAGVLEDSIKSARLIVIKNSVVANNKTFTIADGHLSHLDSVYVLDTIPVGTVDMFIIVNEKPEWDLDAIPKKSIYSPGDIERKTLTFSNYPVVDEDNLIPMYRQYRDLKVSEAGTFTLANGDSILMSALGEVYRLYAKVTFVLKATFADLANGGDPIKINEVSIKSMPRYSYLTPSVGLLFPASAGEYFHGTPTYPVHNVDNYKEETDGLRDSLIWYIPEHRLSDTTYLTYISVKASLKDVDITLQPDEQVTFKKIILGDGADIIPQDSLRVGKDKDGNNASLDNWFITRNTHYKVNATITSFSKTNESMIDIKMRVVNWTETTIGDKDIWNYDLKVSQDEFYIKGADDYYGVVTVETNHPEGWSAEPSHTSHIKFEESPTGTDYTKNDLSGQMGTQLRFKTINGLPDTYIDVKAGPIVKRINLKRTP